MGCENLTLLKSKLVSGPPMSEFISHDSVSPSTRLGSGDAKVEAPVPTRSIPPREATVDHYNTLGRSALETQKSNWFFFFSGGKSFQREVVWAGP